MMKDHSETFDAILLLGPTGSGKTPLGCALQDRGLWGRPCVHFDFGTCLREIVARDRPDDVAGRAEIEFLRNVLECGVLLEDEHFPLARRILVDFLKRRNVAPRTWVVMNGLPRHVGQARGLEGTLNVGALIVLECTPEVVRARIAGNTGGDRAERTDDDPDSVRRKLDLFRQRTEPLCAHYAARGAKILHVEVLVDTTPDRILAQIEDAAQG